ncbi:MAG: membrane protein insertion efficiency factor YidD [Alphaproteobacteria bacterium]|nr:membrane protein insertion efficiency factor YidD [Alphaproteobacteria bacterium]
MNLARTIAIAAIRCYQLAISPWLGKNCRFTPSCSTYATEAVSQHGVLRGSWLAIKRLLRCQPWGASGHDPVQFTHSSHSSSNHCTRHEI